MVWISKIEEKRRHILYNLLLKDILANNLYALPNGRKQQGKRLGIGKEIRQLSVKTPYQPIRTKTTLLLHFNYFDI